MKKLMLLVLVLGISTLYSYRAQSANTFTVDADLGSILGGSGSFDFGWPVNISGGFGYDLVVEGLTAFGNVNYPIDLGKMDLIDSGTLFGTVGGGYRFQDGDDNDDSEHIAEAVLGLTHQAKNNWDFGAKTHLGAGDEGFEWAAYLTFGYRFAI